MKSTLRCYTARFLFKFIVSRLVPLSQSDCREKMENNFPQKAIAAKALAYRNRSKRNWIWFGGVLSVIAALLLWITIVPTSGPELKTKVFICLIGGLFVSGITLKVVFHRINPETAKCPACGYNWELKEGRFIPLAERMETWDKCPGCGGEMGDFVLHRSVSVLGTQPK